MRCSILLNIFIISLQQITSYNTHLYLSTKKPMKKQNLVHPPDLSKSETHRLATRIFKGLELQQQHDIEECECCGRRVGVAEDATPSKCWHSDFQVAYLGAGVPLFFGFIRAAIGIVGVLCVIFCVFALVTNALGLYCKDPTTDCNPNIFNTLSIINKISQTSYLTGQNYLLLIFTFTFVPLIQVIRFHTRRIIAKCDELIDSPSDYAVMVSRLPAGAIEEDIVKMVDQRRGYLTEEERQGTRDLGVVRVVMGFKMGEYIEAIRRNKIAFKASIEDHNDFYPYQIAIIIFSTQQGKDLFLYKASPFQKLLQFFCDPCIPLSSHTIFGQRVAIERAPEPDDIIWQNSNVSVCGAVCRKIWYNFVSFGLLGIGGAAQYGLAVLETKFTDERTVFYIGIGSSLLVAIMNEIIYKFLIYTAQKQRKLTQTKINTNLIIKMGFFLFLNAGVFMVAAKILARIGNFRLEGTLPLQVTQIMILNAVTPHISLIVTDYFELVGRIKRWALKKDIIFGTQMTANLLYEKPTPQISYKYGYLIRTLWLTALYCPLTPIVVPISLFALLLNLAIEKCLHSRSYRTPNMVSSRQNQTALQLLQFIPLIMSFGQLLIYLYFYNFRFELIPQYWSIPIYISIGISLLPILLPMQLINKRLFHIESEDTNRVTYEEAEPNFEATYEMVNPGYTSARRRNRDKLMMKSLYKHIEELVEKRPEKNQYQEKEKGEEKQPLREFLLKMGTKEMDLDNNPLSILFRHQNLMAAFNINQVY